MGKPEVIGFDENGDPIYKKGLSGDASTTVTTDQGPEHIFALKHGINKYAAQALLGMHVELTGDLRDRIFDQISPDVLAKAQANVASFKKISGAQVAIDIHNTACLDILDSGKSIRSAGGQVESAVLQAEKMNGDAMTHASSNTHVFDAHKASGKLPLKSSQEKPTVQSKNAEGLAPSPLVKRPK